MCILVSIKDVLDGSITGFMSHRTIYLSYAYYVYRLGFPIIGLTIIGLTIAGFTVPGFTIVGLAFIGFTILGFTILEFTILRQEHCRCSI
ncbi:hypothetical protein BZA77DRAFT_306333 [Pyronema omphalodes]|nr:hypothetical protein BZA77DRAFT_306333 [Pyronema omphalodes]